MKYNGKFFELSDSESDNYIKYDNQDFVIQNLTDKYRKSKGGNSSVFSLHDPNEDKDYIIKFSNYEDSRHNSVSLQRFNHEIDALFIAKENGFNHVVEIYFDDYYTIDGRTYHYYVMEKGESDLLEYLLSNDLTLQQKVVLCNQILRGIQQLHSVDIYHRDIKPDNIYIIDDVWKVGDLGLIAYRQQDLGINEIRKKIGPYGWMSPEVMNKVLCEKTKYEKIHSCNIDHQSDIFQLGLVFWYVLQGNVPIGKFERKDFTLRDDSLYDLIDNLLQHKKDRRPGNLLEVEDKFSEILPLYNA